MSEAKLQDAKLDTKRVGKPMRHFHGVVRQALGERRVAAVAVALGDVAGVLRRAILDPLLLLEGGPAGLNALRRERGASARPVRLLQQGDARPLLGSPQRRHQPTATRTD